MRTPDPLTAGQAAQELAVSVKTIWRYIGAGILPARQSATGEYLITRADLFAILVEVRSGGDR